MYLLNKYVAITFFILFNSVILFAQPADSCSSRVRINAADSSQIILINGREAGIGSVDTALTRDIYIIQVKADNIRWNSEVVYDTLNIKTCGNEINLNTGRTQVQTDVFRTPAGKGKTINFSENTPKNQSFFKSNMFKILAGSALVLGGVSAYYKLKADDEFDKYQKTKEKNYLDNTDKYDTISGIAFGALQINFGVLIYYFLTD